ncbi:MAG: glycosyltransferase family 39 protein [Acidimicrobiales bacterium]|nr:glycosyltransferase family 39 protein [Acidimicrobiales bacterium]
MARSLADAPPSGAPRPHSTDSAPAAASWPVAPRTVALIATVLAGALSLFHLGHKSLWLDEGYSVGHARMPWGDFWTVLTEREANGALHSLILFPWLRVAEAEWWLRLPSALAMTATVPVLYLLVKRLFDERVGATAALLLAVNGFALQFAQEARSYALVMFMGTLSTLLYVAFVQDGRRGQWWAWVGVSVLLPYAHLFGWLVLGVQATAALLRRGDLARPTRRLVAGFATIAVLGGIVLLLIATGEESGQAEGIPTVSPVRFLGVYARVAGNAGIPLLVVFAALAGYVAWVYGRQLLPLRPFRPTEAQWGVLLLGVWLLLPPVAIGIVSPVQPLFGARYFIILVPAAATLLALGIHTVPKGWVRRVTAVVVGVLVVAGAVGWYLRPSADDIRAAARVVAADARPGDAAVFLPWFEQLPFDAYAVRDGRIDGVVQPVWPDAGWGTFVPDHQDHPDAEEITAVVEGADRLWLVVRDDRGEDDERDVVAYLEALGRDHREVSRSDLDGVDVYLFERG